MKILFIGDHRSVFIKELTTRLKKERPDFDITLVPLTTKRELEEYYYNMGVILKFAHPITPNLFRRLPIIRVLFLLNDIKVILNKHKWDICNLHFAYWFMGFISDSLTNCCSKLVISVWGSDFYRTTDRWKQMIQNRLFKQASAVTATNPTILRQLNKRFNLGPKVKREVVRFGLAPLEEMRKHSGIQKEYFKELLNFPSDGIVVTCGYHGGKIHQHLGIIKSIASVKKQLPGNLFLLFPMTYGLTARYGREIRGELENLKLPYKILDSFLTDEEVAYLRFATDILINLPISDQFSGSMQEHLFAGSRVITGDWLPYDTLYESGISVLKVGNLNEVGPMLLKAIREISEKKIKEDYSTVIWNLSSWERNINKWIDFYEKIVY